MSDFPLDALSRKDSLSALNLRRAYKALSKPPLIRELTGVKGYTVSSSQAYRESNSTALGYDESYCLIPL